MVGPPASVEFRTRTAEDALRVMKSFAPPAEEDAAPVRGAGAAVSCYEKGSLGPGVRYTIRFKESCGGVVSGCDIMLLDDSGNPVVIAQDDGCNGENLMCTYLKYDDAGVIEAVATDIDGCGEPEFESCEHSEFDEQGRVVLNVRDLGCQGDDLLCAHTNYDDERHIVFRYVEDGCEGRRSFCTREYLDDQGRRVLAVSARDCGETPDRCFWTEYISDDDREINTDDPSCAMAPEE
jgi:hypothetical protein